MQPNRSSLPLETRKYESSPQLELYTLQQNFSSLGRLLPDDLPSEEGNSPPKHVALAANAATLGSIILEKNLGRGTKGSSNMYAFNRRRVELSRKRKAEAILWGEEICDVVQRNHVNDPENMVKARAGLFKPNTQPHGMETQARSTEFPTRQMLGSRRQRTNEKKEQIQLFEKILPPLKPGYELYPKPVIVPLLASIEHKSLRYSLIQHGNSKSSSVIVPSPVRAMRNGAKNLVPSNGACVGAHVKSSRKGCRSR